MYFGLKYQLQNDTRLRLNGCLKVVKLSLAGGMSYTDLVIIVLVRDWGYDITGSFYFTGNINNFKDWYQYSTEATYSWDTFKVNIQGCLMVFDDW